VKSKTKLAWSKICTSAPLHSTIAVDISESWATLALAALGPIYISRVLQFDVKSVGTE